MRIVRLFSTIVLAAMVLSACSDVSAPSFHDWSASIVSEQSSESNTAGSSLQNAPIEPLYSVVYTEPQTGYSIISSDLLDTLFIAGSLYYDFDSRNLCPANFSQSYADVREHFEPYKTHPFVQGFGKYADDMMQDVNTNVVNPLVYHILTGQGFSQWWDESVFVDAGEINAFTDDLKQFYQDTGAKEFLKDSPLRKEILAYIPDAAAEMPIADYLREMEGYVGNKDQLYGDTNLHYYSLITPFRPKMGSFYLCNLGQDIYFVAQQAPYSFTTDGSLDIQGIVETSLHEILHLYINELVASRAELIDTLTQNLNPADYTSQLYATSHPWHRIVDEAVVRAIQAGIYRQVYDDSSRAYEELLVKEINAGIVNLDIMYEALRTYEANRDAYPTIDTFMETLIREYLDSSDNGNLPPRGTKENPAVFDMTDPDEVDATD